MTNEELMEKYLKGHYSKQTSADTREHTAISIEYAISVLEEILGKLTEDDEMGNTRTLFDPSYAIIKNKISELKSFIK
jgi:hypothetical protein